MCAKASLEAGKWLMSQSPEVVVIVTPHGMELSKVGSSPLFSLPTRSTSCFCTLSSSPIRNYLSIKILTWAAVQKLEETSTMLLSLSTRLHMR